jgi:hypothetical protein
MGGGSYSATSSTDVRHALEWRELGVVTTGDNLDGNLQDVAKDPAGKLYAVGSFDDGTSTYRMLIETGALACVTPPPTPTPGPTPTGCAPTPGPWALVSPYPSGGIESVSLGSDGTYAYAAGGLAVGVPSSAANRYDPLANTWTSLAPMPMALYAARGVYAANTNTFYVFGGYDDNAVLSTTYRYNVGSGVWSTGAPMPAAREGTTAVYDPVTGKIFVIGGFDASYAEMSQTWEYDPLADTWNTGRANIPAAMGGSGAGRSAIHPSAGGYNGRTGSTLHYRYDIVADASRPRACAGAVRPGADVLNGKATLLAAVMWPARTRRPGAPSLCHGRRTPRTTALTSTIPARIAGRPALTSTFSARSRRARRSATACWPSAVTPAP